MSVKAVLFDADGVTLKSEGYFSDVYSAAYGVPVGDIIPFFKEDYRLCQLGEADLKVRLEEWLKRWQWTGSTDDFLEFWFKHTTPDEEVLAVVDRLRASGVKCYLASDQEKYRAAYLRSIGFADHFDDVFFSCDLGYRKSDPMFFNMALERIGDFADRVVYWDDETDDLNVAAGVGIETHKYENLAQLKGYFGL